MDFSFAPAELALRAELRAWLAKHAPFDYGSPQWPAPEDPAARLRDAREWVDKLHQGRWAAIGWPAKYGGRDATPMEQFLFSEEMATRRMPIPPTVIGIGMAGPVIMAYGTPDQQAR